MNYILRNFLGKAAFALVALSVFHPTHAQAAPVFVGSWDVYHINAPQWSGNPPNGPLAYTAQEAAALLFGGNPSDYIISTIDSNPSNIDNLAWYDVIGYGGIKAAANYNNKYLGQFYGPTSGYPSSDPNAAASAFVRDNLSGASAINFAFVADVPEPGTYMMIGAGLLAVVHRRRRAANVQPDRTSQA